MKKTTIDAGLVARARQALASRTAAMDLFAKLPLSGGEDLPNGSWYKILNAKADEAEILIYSEIGFWGVNAQQFIEDLREVDAKTIHVRINSPGGSVFDGIAIYNALANHESKIIVHIDALAASIASVIAMAGDEIRISEVANVMIHKPWSFAIGTDEDMIKEAAVLKNLESAIVDVYVARTGGDRAKIEAWVKDETWFKGQDAVDNGFADETEKLVKPQKAQARMPANFFAAMYAKMPTDIHDELVGAGAMPPVKFNFSAATPREKEAFLREHGCTHKQAKDIVVNNFKASRDESAELPNEQAARDERAAAEQKTRDESLEALKAIRAFTAAAAIQIAAASIQSRT